MFERNNISINISLDQLIYSQGFSDNTPARPEIATVAARALDMALQLIEPAFIFERLPVHHTGPKSIKIGETELILGESANLLNQAVEAVVYLTTIGEKLERAVNELSRKGNFELAYWLDCTGILALNCVDKEVRSRVENMAAKAGYGVGLSLSPGSLKGWAIEEQKRLCSMLDTGKIGVTINDSSLLVPHKSASSLIGIGPGYTSNKVLPACDYCISEGKCWMKEAWRGA